MKRFVLAAVFALIPTLASAQEELAAVDRSAPMFRLPVYNAKEVGSTVVGLDRYVGPDAADKDTRVVVLSFMASFCAPCKKELPYLQALHEKYKDLGLRVVSVSIDSEEPGQKLIEEMIAQHKVTFPVLKDRFKVVARRWLGSQSPLPSLFFVNKDGIVTKTHRGYSEDASMVLAADVDQALGIKPGSAAALLPVAQPPAAPVAAPASVPEPVSPRKRTRNKAKATAAAKP